MQVSPQTVPPANRPVLRGFRGDVDVEIVHAALSCPGVAPNGFAFDGWRLEHESQPSAPGLDLTLPNADSLQDPLAAVDALIHQCDDDPLPSLRQFPVTGCIARILVHFICGWVRRTALHGLWIQRPDEAVIGEMARRWLGLPAATDTDPIAQHLIARAGEQIRALGEGRADSVGAGRRAAVEIAAEWSRLELLLQGHVETASGLCRSPAGSPDLPGALLAAMGRSGLPVESSIMDHLNSSVCSVERESAAETMYIDDVPESLSPILQYAAMTFHAVLRVNRALLAEGRDTMSVDLGYGPFSLPCQPSWEAARQSLAHEFSVLPPGDRKKLQQDLEPLGVMAVYEIP